MFDTDPRARVSGPTDAFPSRRALLPSVRTLIDHLAASFSDLDEE
jgi:hypothetical protein